MTWKMEVRRDDPAPPGWYEAECRKVEDVDTTFGMRLRWTFWLLQLGMRLLVGSLCRRVLKLVPTSGLKF